VKLTNTVLDVRLQECRLVQLALEVSCQPDFAQRSALRKDDIRIEHFVLRDTIEVTSLEQSIRCLCGGDLVV
jgi:hypothetical protein